MYLVEGNIGAGKSTFLSVIAQHLPYASVCMEPREQWQQENGQSILEHFYKDPHRWAYTMETLAMIWRVKNHILEQQHASPFRVMERSVYSGHYVFAHNDYEQGFLTDLEWSLYLQFFNFMVPQACRAPQGFIYLRTEPEIAYERMKVRSRGSESTVPLEYLQQIDAKHRSFLLDKKGVLPELEAVPVLVLDCNQEFERDVEQQKKLMAKVEAFLQETQMAISSKQTPQKTI
jgi:deoxyguanosine kinase